MRFSPLTQITPANVGNLVRAWEFRTGDLDRRAPEVMKRTKFQATPLLVEDSLIFCSPFNEVIALDPGSGAQKWRYDPKITTGQRPANRYNCRGVAYWVDDQAAEGAACRARIFMGTNDVRVIALDARTGIPCADFGTNGEIKLEIGGAGMAGRIPDHVGAGGEPRRRHCRLFDLGQSPRRGAARHRARLRCADRASALEFGSAGSWRHHRRPRQCLGADVGGRRARAGVPADVFAEPGFLGRQAARQQRARQFRGGAARRDRRTGVVVPDRASRCLGLRSAGAADAGAHRHRRGHARRRDPADQAGLCVRARPRHRQAGMAGRGAQRSARRLRKASSCRRRSRFRPTCRRWCRNGFPPTMCSASFHVQAARAVASRDSRARATRASTRRPRRRAR